MPTPVPVWNFARIFSELAETVPDRPAIIWGETAVTYGALRARAYRLASWLTAQGVQPGDAVALDCPNRPEYLEGFYAALCIGARPTNVNYRYLPHEIAYVLRDADARVILAGPEQSDTARAAASKIDPQPTVLVVGEDYEQALATHPNTAPSYVPTGDDLIYLYTGGTTGAPKGVMWRNEDLYLALWTSARGNKPPTDPIAAVNSGRRAATTLPACPLMHGTGLFGTLGALAGGGTIVLLPDGRFDPVITWETCARHDVQALLIVGDAFGRPLLDALRANPTRFDLHALRAIVSSGVTWSPEVKRGLLDALPQVRCIDSLGSSEGLVTRTETHADTPILPARFARTTTTRVIDDENREVPAGVIGRLATAGFVPVGYRNDPVASARTFPTIAGVRYAVAGDLARAEDDGTITLLGRGNACINSGGEKIYPEEVELTLRSHPEVLDAIVVGIPDPQWGDRVVAIVATATGEVPASLDDWCRNRLAAFKVPRQFVARHDLERSVAGKVNLERLRAIAVDASPAVP